MRAPLIGFATLVLAFVAACGSSPPTKDEVAIALKDLRSEEENKSFLDLLRILDAGATSDPSPATSASSQGSGSSPRLPGVEIDEMKCDRVDRTSYDCDVTWRYQRSAATKGLYRLVHGSDKWTARRLP